MNLLKGITEELKGSDESGRTDDVDRSPTTPDRRDAASTSTTSETESDSQDDEGVRDDEHLCAFCGTVFAASRGACPDCDAEIVIRGER